MSDPNQNTVGELIQAYYAEHKGPNYFDEQIIIKGWKSVVGAFIAQYTRDLYIKDGVLFVKLTSDSLRTELSYSKTVLLRNLNNLVEREVLSDIVFR